MNDKIESEEETEIDNVEPKRNWKEVLKDGYVWTVYHFGKMLNWIDDVLEGVRPSHLFLVMILAVIAFMVSL